MRKRDGLLLLLLVLLGVAVAAAGVRVAGHAREARAELGRVKLTELEPRTLEVLHGLEDDVLLTYYVSARASMPSHLRRLEDEVTDLLEAFRREGGERVAYQIVDPESSADLSRYAAGRRVAPFRVRTVTRDAYTEKTVWSTLTIAYGPRAPSVINGVVPEHLPRLQRILVEHIEQADAPRLPRIALSVPRPAAGGDAPPPLSFELLRRFLEPFGEVTELCVEAGDPVPEDTDVLFWMEPGEVGPDALRTLDELLARGRGVVIAGSAYHAEVEPPPDDPGAPRERWRFEARESPYGAATLLANAGLKPVRGLLLDEQGDRLEGDTESAPFVFRCIAPQQNFRTLEGQPNATLLFAGPTPLALEGDVLSERGWTPQVLATSSDRTFQLPFPSASVPLAELDPASGRPAPQQALGVLLRPSDPWRGSLFAFASASPFADGYLEREGFAHRRLVQVLLANLASEDRLVLHRAGYVESEPLPPLGPGQRVLWRGLVVLLLPGLLLVVALARGIGGSGTRSAARGERPKRSLVRVRGALALRGAAALAVALGLVRLGDLRLVRADLTEEGLNRLAPRTVELARACTGDGALTARLVFSARDRLPPSLRAPARRLVDKLDDLRRAGARLELVRVDPADLDDAGREALAEREIEPDRSVLNEEGATTVRRVYTTLELERADGRTERLHFPSPVSFENLEFKLAFALWRLETGRSPHVAFASDVPRLSPAESHTDYLQKGLFAPSGTDVYSLARDVAEDAGFRVTHVNPRDPKLPEDVDLLIWLQPRRSIENMLEETVDYLHRGGAVLLAAQHFNIEAQQHRGGTDQRKPFEVVHWPQPQSPDVELLYFPDAGIHLVREVLFDRLMTRIEQETQVNRDADRRDWEVQDEALPFLIRAVAANFAKDSVITRGLGDQGFIWGNRLSWDGDRLRELGITAHPLIFSSERTWSFDWKGDFLPRRILDGPPPGPDGEPAYLGPQPLAVLFEGAFPPLDETSPAADAAPGRLLFVGDSELFKNRRLFEPDFRADHLLLNAVAALTLDEGLAEVAARRPVARGFDYVEPEQRLVWRAAVLALFPSVLLLFGALRALWRRRPLAGISGP